jgi:Asp-tRNA(Asn)/Glu-tRNA(Gln) amidotransferase A subunit family amidase
VTHPQDLGLRAQAAAIAAGELDPAELLDATLERIAEREPALNSTPVVFADEARRMLTEAPSGPLHGVPLTIKDMYALPWRAARNGTAFDLLPAAPSGAYERLRAAGAVIVGVANQHEAGMGSGGSTRLPAAYCGVVGLKVTYRALPYDHYFGMGTTFSAPGAFGRDAQDARLLSEALLARPLSPPDGRASRALRVGVVRDPFWSDVQPVVASACEQVLDGTGWDVRDITIEHLELAAAVLTVRLGAEAGCPPQAVLDTLSPTTRAVMLSNLLRGAAPVARADRVRAAIRASVAAVLADVDVIAWPTVPTTAPPLDRLFADLPSGTTLVDVANMRHSVLANVTGQPGINVPAGFVDGLPVGLQLLGAWGAEALLLAAAEHVEDATARAFVDAAPSL